MKIRDIRPGVALYALSEPVECTRWVVVSTATDIGGEEETYIFPANREGEVTSWSELPGSTRGTSSHTEVLRAGGFEL